MEIAVEPHGAPPDEYEVVASDGDSLMLMPDADDVDVPSDALEMACLDEIAVAASPAARVVVVPPTAAFLGFRGAAPETRVAVPGTPTEQYDDESSDADLHGGEALDADAPAQRPASAFSSVGSVEGAPQDSYGYRITAHGYAESVVWLDHDGRAAEGGMVDDAGAAIEDWGWHPMQVELRAYHEHVVELYARWRSLAAP